MDTTTSSGSSPAMLQLHNIIPENPITAMELPFPSFLRLKRHCRGSSVPVEFFLAYVPSIVLHVLTTCDLGPRDLVKVEATCSFFRKPTNFSPDFGLSISELAGPGHSIAVTSKVVCLSLSSSDAHGWTCGLIIQIVEDALLCG